MSNAVILEKNNLEKSFRKHPKKKSNISRHNSQVLPKSWLLGKIIHEQMYVVEDVAEINTSPDGDV